MRFQSLQEDSNRRVRQTNPRTVRRFQSLQEDSNLIAPHSLRIIPHVSNPYRKILIVMQFVGNFSAHFCFQSLQEDSNPLCGGKWIWFSCVSNPYRKILIPPKSASAHISLTCLNQKTAYAKTIIRLVFTCTAAIILTFHNVCRTTLFFALLDIDREALFTIRRNTTET